MKKLIRVVVWTAGTIVSGFLLLAVFGLWSLSHKSYAFPDGDLPRHLAGRWDWSTRAHPCDDSAHVISFGADRRTMTISMPARSTTDTGWTAIYDLQSLTAARLRGAIRGEKRLTDHGVSVVWDLVMFGPDEYHWHRSDWKPWDYTASIVRCKLAPRAATSPTSIGARAASRTLHQTGGLRIAHASRALSFDPPAGGLRR